MKDGATVVGDFTEAHAHPSAIGRIGKLRRKSAYIFEEPMRCRLLFGPRKGFVLRKRGE